jgi:C-terminal processing protease CtpA/Prc
MTAVELQENPVLVAEVLDELSDGVKTAYLMYNAFTSDFDMALNDAFGDFKAQGVERLILDLRYNGGGSIRTATHLASMIYSTDASKIFAQFVYNNKYQDYILSTYGESAVTEWFTDELDTTTYNHSPVLPLINNLGLNDIYIITASGTASASEMIINGLDPYMNVVQVGDTTRGKYVGSFTIKDYYTNNDGSLNTEHKWAIQPITLKISNSDGESDYVGGLIPDVAIEEDFRELLPLGDPDEALLAATLDYILGSAKSSKSSFNELPDYRVIADSRDFKPFSKEMYVRYPKISQDEFYIFREDK